MMAGCLFFVYLVHVVIGYPLDDVEDVPLPPSYMEQQSQLQGQRYQPSFRQQAPDYSPDTYYNNYAQAGNIDPNYGYYDQQNSAQYPYPRMMQEDPAAGGEQVTISGDSPPTVVTPESEANPEQPEQPQQQPPHQGGGPGANYAQPLSLPQQPSQSHEGPRDEPDGHVIPVYTPPKNKHTDKEDEPYLTPQWQSDEGIGDGRDPKIVAALEAITADLIAKGKELTSERHWAKQVESMLEIYKDKVNNVHVHTEQIRTDMKALLKKKRQIENMEVQSELNSKLRLAQEDLEALDGAMSHVQSKADEFAEKKKKLEKQIEKISGHIKKLQRPHESAEEAEEGGAGDKTEEQEEHGKKEEAEKTSTTTVDADGEKEKETAEKETAEKEKSKTSKAEDEDKTGKKLEETTEKPAEKEKEKESEKPKAADDDKSTGKEKEKEKEKEKTADEAKFRAQALDNNSGNKKNLSRRQKQKTQQSPHLRGLENLDLD